MQLKVKLNVTNLNIVWYEYLKQSKNNCEWNKSVSLLIHLIIFGGVLYIFKYIFIYVYNMYTYFAWLGGQTNQLFTLLYWSTKIFNLLIYSGCICVVLSLEFKSAAWLIQLHCTDCIIGEKRIIHCLSSNVTGKGVFIGTFTKRQMYSNFWLLHHTDMLNGKLKFWILQNSKMFPSN